MIFKTLKASYLSIMNYVARERMAVLDGRIGIPVLPIYTVALECPLSKIK